MIRPPKPSKPDETMKRTTERTLFKAATALVLLGGAVALNRQEFAKVLGRAPRFEPFLAGFGLYAAGTLITFSRWYLLARTLDLPIRYREALKLGFIAHFFNILIPGAVGGDLIRAGYARAEFQRKDRAVASVALQVFFTVAGLFSLAAGAGIVGWNRLGTAEHRLIVLAVCGWLFLAAGLSLWLFPSRKRRALFFQGARLDASIETSRLARRRWPCLLLALSAATASHAANVLAFERVAHAFYRDVPTLADHFVFVPLILFSTAFPLPLGALGVSEALSGRLLRLAGFQGGAVVMLGYRLLQYGSACLSGGVYIANRRQARSAIEAGEGLLTRMTTIHPTATTTR